MKLTPIERKNRYGTLLSIYGSLLTDLIRRRMNDFYDQDLSLSEIAQNEQVSRNAVFISLSQGEKELDKYEEKMKLMSRSMTIRADLDQLLTVSDDLERKSIVDKIKGELDYGI